METILDASSEPSASRRARRRHSRAPVQLEARLRVGAREVPAVAVDISPGGAFLRCDLEQLGLGEEGARLVVTLRLPHGRELAAEVEVRWRGVQPLLPGVGVRFLGFLPQGVHAA